MTEMFGMPGAGSFMAKPTAAAMAAEAERERRRVLHGDPERNRAARAAQLKVLTDRHVRMLQAATDPILRALIEAHGPHGDGLWPDCAGCPERDNEYGDSDPEMWPCGVWMFISDRMEAT